MARASVRSGRAAVRPFLRLFVAPAVLCALGFAAALAAVMQYSLRAYVPGSLEAGGFTLANFAALVHVTLPVMVIMLAAALSHIDRDYERAAASLGAGPIRAFLTVTLPLSTPGIIAGVTTAFAWTFSAFATPQLIGGGRVNMVANLVYQLGFASFNFPFAASLSVAGLLLTFAVLGLMRVAAGRLEAIRQH